MKRFTLISSVVGIALLILTVTVFIYLSQSNEIAAEEELKFSEDIFDEESLVDVTFSYIDILQRLYFITQEEPSNAETSSGLVIEWTSEAMKDREALKTLLLQVDQVQNHDLLTVSTTGLLLEVTIERLIRAHTEWIDYLRTFNPNYADVAELQYQLSSFGSETRSAFMVFGENALIYPIVFFDLSDDPDKEGEWRISEESKEKILTKIDASFGDIFEEEIVNREKTDTTNVVVFVAHHLRSYFSPEVIIEY